jgi:tRNA(adenine34) deaminase
MTKLFKNYYMELAIKEAYTSYIKEEIPVGAVIVNNNHEIISMNHNQSIELCDPTAHAEILAIRSACSKIKNHRLNNCTLYTTLEPCPMCAGAILQSKIPLVYFGAYSPKYGAIENNATMFHHNYPHNPEIYGGIYEEECKDIIKKFFK